MFLRYDPNFFFLDKWERRGRVYVRTSMLVGTHTRRRLQVLCLGDVCEEIDAGWDTLEKKVESMVGEKRI